MIRQLVSTGSANGIRPLRPARDLGQLADLIEQAFGEELSEGGEHILRELRLFGRLGPLSVLFVDTGPEVSGLLSGFVWEEDGRVAGNVTVNRPTGHPRRWQISNVAVLEAYRRQGIGRRLVEAAIGLILRRGGDTAYLFVRENNPAAVRLYEGMGFVEIDRTTDLKLTPQSARGQAPEVRLLRRLKPREGETLYELASQAAGPGQRWLSTVRRRQFALSSDDRFFRWIGSLFSQEEETFWGAFVGDRLQAGMSLRATRLWNRKPHRLKLWIHPRHRGQIEDALAQDVVALLSLQARRPSSVSLPACETQAIDALLRHGFDRIRTLILMKLEL